MSDVVPIKKHRGFYRQQRRTAAGVLRDVRALNPREILVIAIDHDGEIIVQGHPPDPANAMWLMESAKLKLLNPNGR